MCAVSMFEDLCIGGFILTEENNDDVFHLSKQRIEKRMKKVVVFLVGILVLTLIFMLLQKQILNA